MKSARKNAHGLREKALAEPMLLYWLPLCLWLCDDEAGSFLLGGRLSSIIQPLTYGRKRRQLGLGRTSGAMITTADGALVFKAGFETLLSMYKIDAVALMGCFEQVASWGRNSSA